MEETTGSEAADAATVELTAAAEQLERWADAVDLVRESDRDVARAVARRLERINQFRLQAQAAHTAWNAARNADPDAARVDAAGARARVRFSHSPELERRSVRAQLAAALRTSERAAETQLAMAEDLATAQIATMDALRAGEITERHARLVWEHTIQVPEADRAVFEEQALRAARRLSTTRLVGKLRDLQERLHPETVTERHRAAVGTREMWIDPVADGMAILSLRDSAAKLAAIGNRIEEYARGITADPAETRTLAQVRADVTAEFLLTGQLGEWRIVPTVHVTVPVLSLLGHSEELAILDGYGPIDLETARRLTAEAPSFTRILTHPVTGTVLAVDKCRATDPMRTWLLIRDQTCRAPGCGRRAVYCELDHCLELARDSGPTAFDNLAYLCVNHHKLKTLAGWQYRHLDRNGTLEWTTPLGQTYITEPAVNMRGAPHLADALREKIAELDQPPPEYDDTIPDDLYAELQIAFDAELEADRASGALNALLSA